MDSNQSENPPESFPPYKVPQLSLPEYLLSGPRFDGFDIPRDKDTGRDVES